jgi:L-fucose isomerase-like protein
MQIRLVSVRTALTPEIGRELDRKSGAFLGAIASEGLFEFGSENPSLNVFFVESGGSENKFVKIYKDFAGPYWILATQNSNSLASSLEILSYLEQHGEKGEIIFGDPKEVARKLYLIAKATEARRKLSGQRIGIIGHPSDWLIASSVDYKKAKERFGIELIDIPFEELKAEIDKRSYEESEVPAEVRKTKLENGVTEKTLEGALCIYGALKRLIAKYGLSGFSIRCFDLLGPYKNTSCLALSILNQEGYSASCEGDEGAVISMAILRALTGKSSFQCNPSYFDEAKNELILAHCTIPMDMIHGFRYFTHFESRLGVGLRGNTELGKVTVFKISNDLERYHCLEAEITKNLSRDDLCRTQIVLRSETSFHEFFDHPYGNHLLVVYGGYEDLVSEFFRLMAK